MSIPYSHSLKEKRSVVRKIKDKVRAKHEVIVAEVAGLDTWQRCVLGFAIVTNERSVATSRTDKVLRFVEGLGVGEVVRVDREVVSYDEEGLS